MKALALSWLAVAMAFCLPVRGIDIQQRSESGGKQFIVYSSDVRLRQRVASYAGELKTDVLQIARRERPVEGALIVITLERASTLQGPGEPPALLRLIDTDAAAGKSRSTSKSATTRRRSICKSICCGHCCWTTPTEGFSDRGRHDVCGGPLVDCRRPHGDGAPPRNAESIATSSAASWKRTICRRSKAFSRKNPTNSAPPPWPWTRALAMGLLQMLIDQPGGRTKTWPASSAIGRRVMGIPWPCWPRIFPPWPGIERPCRSGG